MGKKDENSETLPSLLTNCLIKTLKSNYKNIQVIDMTAHDRNEFARALSSGAKNKEPDKQIDLFKELNFKYFIDGEITRFGSEYIIDATISDIETNTVISPCNCRVSDKLDYDEMTIKANELISKCIVEFPIIAGRIKSFERGEGAEGSQVLLNFETPGQYEGSKMIVYKMVEIGDVKTSKPLIAAEGEIIDSRGEYSIGTIKKLSYSKPVKAGDIIQVMGR